MEVVSPFFGTISSRSDDPPSSTNSLSGLIYSPSSWNPPLDLFRRDLSEWTWSWATCSRSDCCIPDHSGKMETSLFIVIKGKLECGINGDRFITQHDAQGVRAPVCRRCYKAWKTAHQASVNTPHCLFCSLYSKYACQILILSAIFAVHTKIPSLFTSIAGNTSVSMQHVNITVYGGKLML